MSAGSEVFNPMAAPPAKDDDGGDNLPQYPNYSNPYGCGYSYSRGSGGGGVGVDRNSNSYDPDTVPANWKLVEDQN